MVQDKRLELLWLSPLDPKSSASTNFANPANILKKKMVPSIGLEPTTY